LIPTQNEPELRGKMVSGLFFLTGLIIASLEKIDLTPFLAKKKQS